MESVERDVGDVVSLQHRFFTDEIIAHFRDDQVVYQSMTNEARFSDDTTFDHMELPVHCHYRTVMLLKRGDVFWQLTSQLRDQL